MIATIAKILPTHAGLLPKWLLFVASAAIFNSLQCYHPTLSQFFIPRIFSAAPKQGTPLAARLFGNWTLMSALVRIYAAYHITEPAIYAVTLWSFAIVLVSNCLEVGWFRTAVAKSPGIAPAIVISGLSIVWMLISYSFYVK